jgi:hypothetical protein
MNVTTHTRGRRIALSLAVILTVLLALNNWIQLSRALAFFEIVRG